MIPFVEVATQRSFTRAAEILDIPTSTISRRIARLEKDLGVQLFNRSPRKVELTKAGEAYFKSCEKIVLDAKDAKDALLRSTKELAGDLRLSTPIDFGAYCSDIIVGFAQKYPEINIDVQNTEFWADLITDPIDLEIRVGEMPDSNLIARKLTELQAGLYASPKFLQKNPIPQSPDDIHKIPCLCLRQNPVWHLKKGDELIDISPQRVRCSVNSINTLTELAVAGLGLSFLNLYKGEALAKEGKLVRVLGDWSLPTKPVYIVAANRQIPARVRAFVDYLLAEFQDNYFHGN